MLLSVAFLATACGAFGRDEPSGGAAREEDRLTLSSPSEKLSKGAADEFATDFTRHSVPYSEIRSGRPSKDDMADQKITVRYHIKIIPASTPITAPGSIHLSSAERAPRCLVSIDPRPS